MCNAIIRTITSNEWRHGPMDGLILENSRSYAQCNTLSANWKVHWIFGSHLPWCFALNRHNSARNLSYYFIDMLDLKECLPEAFDYLYNGGFSGSLIGQKFTKIPMDQMIEMSINRLSKEIGGLYLGL